jgi:TatD DNase family protein
LAKKPEVVSLGECGLDFDRMFSTKEVQIKVLENTHPFVDIQVFNAQLELARELGMPLFLHERAAFGDFVDIMNENKDLIPKVVLFRMCLSQVLRALLHGNRRGTQNVH